MERPSSSLLVPAADQLTRTKTEVCEFIECKKGYETAIASDFVHALV